MPEETIRDRVKAGIDQQLREGIASGAIQGVELPPEPSAAAPPVAPEAAPAPVAPTAPGTQAQPQAEQTPEGDLLLGKYKDMTALETGYFNMVNRAKTVADENTRLREQLVNDSMGQPQPAMPQAPTVPGSLPGADARVNPAARDVERTVAKLSENLGLDRELQDDLTRALGGGEAAAPQPDITATIQDAVKSAVQSELAPMQAQNQAQSYMNQTYPDASKFERELELFVESDPVTKQGVQTLMAANDYSRALEYAWLRMQSAAGTQAQVQLTQESQIAEAERQVARPAAGMVTSAQGTPVHAADPNFQGPDPQRIKDLAEAARSGNVQAQREYRRIMLIDSNPRLKEKLDQIANGSPILS